LAPNKHSRSRDISNCLHPIKLEEWTFQMQGRSQEFVTGGGLKPITPSLACQACPGVGVRGYIHGKNNFEFYIAGEFKHIFRKRNWFLVMNFIVSNMICSNIT